MHKRRSSARLVLALSILLGLTVVSCEMPSPSSPVTQVYDIQGEAHRSPLEGQQVQDVPGIVTALARDGFWMQAPVPDGNDATSDGIFVFTDSLPGVQVGDEVTVSGTVSEYRPGGEDENTTITQITGLPVSSRSRGGGLPAPIVLGAGGRMPPTEVIDDDATGDVETSGTYDPHDDGIDFYESLEGMRVQVNDALVIGPTNAYGETWVVGDGGASATDLTARGGLLIRAGDLNPERIQLDDPLYPGAWPELNVGARLIGPATGVLHYGFGNYELYVTEPFSVDPSAEVLPETTGLLGGPTELTIATLNVNNLGGNAPSFAFGERALIITRYLGSPDIIALEEMQDDNGENSAGGPAAARTFERLIQAIEAGGGPTYDYVQIDPQNGADGGAPGANIRIGFLYDPARIDFAPRPGGDARTPNRVLCADGVAVLEKNPGRIDPGSPAFRSSRKPLAAECAFNGETIYLIGVHFVSKGGDDPLYGRRQPPRQGDETQRINQARAVNAFVDELLACDPQAKVVVLGDVNDFQFSPTVDALKDGVLHNLMDLLPENKRYSYVYQGNSQVLDQILVSGHVLDRLSPEYDVVHVNAEFTHDEQISDHDPAIVRLSLGR
jgi:predicted extracellular nuclease